MKRVVLALLLLLAAAVQASAQAGSTICNLSDGTAVVDGSSVVPVVVCGAGAGNYKIPLSSFSSILSSLNGVVLVDFSGITSGNVVPFAHTTGTPSVTAGAVTIKTTDNDGYVPQIGDGTAAKKTVVLDRTSITGYDFIPVAEMKGGTNRPLDPLAVHGTAEYLPFSPAMNSDVQFLWYPRKGAPTLSTIKYAVVMDIFDLTGPQLITNGQFTTNSTGWALDTGWTYNGTSMAVDKDGDSPCWSYASDTAVKDADGTTALAEASFAATASNVYQLVYQISSSTVGTVTASVGGTAGSADSANGTYVYVLTAANTNGLTFTPTNTARLALDKISLRDVTSASEQLTNGTFTGNANDWTLASGWAYNSNAVDKNAGGTGTLAHNTFAAVAGHTYRLTYVISNWTAGSVQPRIGSQGGASVGANGTYAELITAYDTAGFSFTPTDDARLTVDNVSIRDVTSSPELVKNGDFSQSAWGWTGTGLIADTTVAPFAQHQYRVNFSITGCTGLTTGGCFTGGTTGWTLGSGWAYGTDNVNKSSDGTGTLTNNAFSPTASASYAVSYTISNLTAGTVQASLGGINGTERSANGTYTDIIYTSNTNGLAFTPSNASRFTIDDIVVRESNALQACVGVNCGLAVGGNGYYTQDINTFGTHKLIFQPLRTTRLTLDDIQLIDLTAVPDEAANTATGEKVGWKLSAGEVTSGVSIDTGAYGAEIAQTMALGSVTNPRANSVGYVAGDFGTPQPQNGYWYKQTVSSCTSASSQPTFTTTIGGTTSDGSCSWTNMGYNAYRQYTVVQGNRSDDVTIGSWTGSQTPVAIKLRRDPSVTGNYGNRVGLVGVLLYYTYRLQGGE